MGSSTRFVVTEATISLTGVTKSPLARKPSPNTTSRSWNRKVMADTRK